MKKCIWNPTDHGLHATKLPVHRKGSELDLVSGDLSKGYSKAEIQVHMLYSGSLSDLTVSSGDRRVKRGQIFVFINDLIIFLLQERAPDIGAVAAVIQWLEEKLSGLRASFNKTSSQAFLPRGAEFGYLPAEKQVTLPVARLKVPQEGMAVLVVIPVDSAEHQRRNRQDVVRRDPAGASQNLGLMNENLLTNFHIFCSSAAQKMDSLLRRHVRPQLYTSTRRCHTKWVASRGSKCSWAINSRAKEGTKQSSEYGPCAGEEDEKNGSEEEHLVANIRSTFLT